jgi:hypothetical protein
MGGNAVTAGAVAVAVEDVDAPAACQQEVSVAAVQGSSPGQGVRAGTEDAAVPAPYALLSLNLETEASEPQCDV